MKHSIKRRCAKLLIRILGISNLLRKLQPIATEISFGADVRPKIDEIREMLIPLALPLNDYVRFGDDFDGGYLLSSRIELGTNCISVGAGTNISFDIAISKFVNEVQLYDHTIPSLPQLAPSNVTFIPKGVGLESIGEFQTLNDCVARFPDVTNLILKMDIEGDEWAILDSNNLIDLSRFDQIAIEFHDFYEIHDDAFFQKVARVLKKINTTHQVINVHANNWGKFEVVANTPFADVLEVSYILKSRINGFLGVSSRQILNKPCNPAAPEIELVF